MLIASFILAAFILGICLGTKYGPGIISKYTGKCVNCGRVLTIIEKLFGTDHCRDCLPNKAKR